jgi:hypothetical protein
MKYKVEQEEMKEEYKQKLKTQRCMERQTNKK